MLRGSSRSRNFFRRLVVNGVNNSKTQAQNNCLVRLYDADVELKAISSELDSFDGKKDPLRCNLLVNQLRTAQDKVISLLFQLMDDCSCERASRDYRMKFPDEILLSEGSESLNGQIWFGAECLAAGSNILNHTKESTMLRPMAKTLTTHLDSLRNDLRDLVTDGDGAVRINQALVKKMVTFDHIFATFEYEYVRTMLPIRTVAEVEKLQEVAVLFSETLIDCVKRGLIKQDDIEEFQPIVMIAIPRLAIVRGLLYKSDNPIYTRHKSQMCSLFQPFHGPLHSIRRLLRGLNPQELISLEKMLANDQTASESSLNANKPVVPASTTKQSRHLQSSEMSNEECSYLCQGDSGEGTSNNYSNILMDGLKYPVDQKRVNQCPNSAAFYESETTTQQDESTCNGSCFEAPSSSSKLAIVACSSDESPVGSSPTSSLSSNSECKGCSLKSRAHEYDKNCCLSPSNNDPQLERITEDTGPLVGHLESVPEVNELHTAETITAAIATDGQSIQPGSFSKVEKANDSEALLEELFMKQAQQLLHRLFVAISGVADQLQSNFASDLRFILRHIFSSELEETTDEEINEEDEESEARDYSNNESDSSLPIEQGIEAQEVANLIDLSSGYPLNSPYEYDQEVQYITPPATSNYSYLDSTNTAEVDSFPSRSSLYATIAHHSNSSEGATDPRAAMSQDILNQDVNEEMLADLMRASNQPELTYESRSSPNTASILDESRHRQQPLQQSLQSIPRASTRSSSSRALRHESISENNSNLSDVERRSRRHGHAGSRQRRVRGPPVWVPDQLVVACSCCSTSFTLFRRRHHCRACGQIFCADCSKFTKNLNCWGYNGPVRVCESCFNQT